MRGLPKGFDVCGPVKHLLFRFIDRKGDAKSLQTTIRTSLRLRGDFSKCIRGSTVADFRRKGSGRNINQCKGIE
jgi:hypothetical protein